MRRSSEITAALAAAQPFSSCALALTTLALAAIAAVTIVIAAPGPAATTPAPAAPTHPAAREAADMTELTRLEAAWNQAHLLGDAATLDRIFADDVVIAVPNMAAMTKAEALGAFRSAKFRFDKYATSQMRTRLYGDAAVVTGRLQRHRDMGDRAVDDDWQFTKVYIRRTAGWQVVSFHASPYAE